MTDTKTTLSITADDLIAMEPCDDWPEDRIREIAGDKRWTAMEILALEQVPPEDRLWVVLRPELIAEPVLHELACRFAEEVLPIWEAQHPNDRRPHEAITAKRAWMRREITDGELAAAQEAAEAAAEAAAESAAGTAASAAEWAATGAAWVAGVAESVARDAAWAAEWAAAEVEWAAARERQIEIVREVLKSEVSDD